MIGINNYREHLIIIQCSIKEALMQLTKLGIDGILFVVDANDRLIGSITDGDVRRGLLRGVSIDQDINSIIREHPRYLNKGDYDILKVIKYREENFRIVPILDEENRVVKIINFRYHRSYLPVDVVIMAGGRGQRLSPLTDTIPKPLLDVAGKPIMEYNLARLSLFGIDDYWFCVNYLANQIEDYFKDGSDRNIKISYVREDKPLGTVGSLSQINDFRHDYILLTNSDLLTNLDYEHFFLEFRKSEADLAVVSIPYEVNVPYAVLEMDSNKVLALKEKPTYTYYSNAGIYLFKREVLDLIPKDSYYNATDLMEKLIANGKTVYAYPMMGYWLDIGSPYDYDKAQHDVKNIKF